MSDTDINDNVLPFAPLKPASDANGNEKGDWLSKYRQGECFLARPSVEFARKLGLEGRSRLIEFWIVDSEDKARLLRSINNMKEDHSWVDPVEFCKEYQWYEDKVRLVNGE